MAKMGLFGAVFGEIKRIKIELCRIVFDTPLFETNVITVFGDTPLFWRNVITVLEGYLLNFQLIAKLTEIGGIISKDIPRIKLIDWLN